MAPRIKMFGLGGTLQQGEKGGLICPKYPLDELLDRLFTEGKDFRNSLMPEEIINKDSNDLNETDMYTLLIKTHAAALDPVIDAIMVTMGTDRMADIASLLEFSIRPPRKPIIFTGSMKTIEQEGNDVRANISSSISLIYRLLSEDEVYAPVVIVMGRQAIYAHSSVKIRTDTSEAFACAWNKPFARFDNGLIEMRKRKLQPGDCLSPQLYLPKVGRVSVEYLSPCCQPNMDQLLKAEAVVYVGTGDGNVSMDVHSLMAMLSKEFFIPQFLCSAVPLRHAVSSYEAGTVPDGVAPSILPVAATAAKLAVVLRAAQYLSGRTKQDFVLRCFQEDFAGEYLHWRS